MFPHIRPSSFTANYKGITNVLITEASISLAFDPSKGEKPPLSRKYKAIWDTGATNSVITRKVVEKCGLKPIGIAKVYTANGSVLSEVYLVGLGVPNNLILSNARVSVGDIYDADILIGMDIINLGDFAVTNKDGNTTFSFRFPSIERIDFTIRNRAKRE